MTPCSARPLPSRLLRRIGRRGTSLLFFAVLDLIYAGSLLTPPPRARTYPQYLFLEAIAPLWVFAALWAGVGIVCLVNAFRASDKLGFAAAIGMKVLWGSIYVAAQCAGVERAYVAATIWLCLAGWVAIISTWPEPPDFKAGAIPAEPHVPPGMGNVARPGE